ncbi:MAG: hypothetical protein ACPGVU_13660 [Limisphaerales bacterium]
MRFLLCLLAALPVSAADLRVEAKVGNVSVVFESKRQWTPARIDFRGQPMTTERSAYGSVFSFPGVGFIGTTHFENEPEQLRSTTWFIDGKAVDVAKKMTAGKELRFVRKSKIRSFETDSEWRIKNGRLYETVDVRATSETPLKLVYHFMHAWQPTVSAFLAGNDGETKELSGELRNGKDVARKFYIEQEVDWLAVYEPKSRQFAVSRLLRVPEQGGARSRIWNVPGTYRKYYLMCFHQQTVPAGWRGQYQMVTSFGAASQSEWKSKARRLAAELKQP